MKRYEVIDFILKEKIIAVIRAEVEKEVFYDAVDALYSGGIRCIEITMTSPNALEIIETLAKKWKNRDLLLGVGTVLDGTTCRSAILAGAQFVVTPTCLPEVVDIARKYGTISMCGGFTPTELLNAWQTGAEFVKLFPANLGGPEYVKAILGPLPHLQLVPTGGINHENAKEYINAGAVAVGVGGKLVSKNLLASKNFDQIAETAKLYKSAISF
ncbi:MAG: bifunctional 4-hydroxy-2-oxoglutarate aldolase/2-dehydro-3-deoxy-phosphogluconate aldolase [Candidatus Hydrogenedentes bacterium]|nr:bifunctional 4-hydroxy-2-oxoglutarate aldolase/2-dehydro-3-deoxy-phosphogluconate aldolase [Candidatus Hydrogenedentota bacterium]